MARELTAERVAAQDGTCSSSFLKFLSELEHDGIVNLQHGNVPPRLKGAAALVGRR